MIEEIKALLETKIDNAVVQVMDLTGTQDHLGLLIVSDVFKDKMLLDQHRIVMDILKEPLGDRLHAVKIKTMTHEQYNKTQE